MAGVLCCINVYARTDTNNLPEFERVSNRIELNEAFSVLEVDSSLTSQFENRSLGELIKYTGVGFIKDYGPGQLMSPSFRGASAAHTQVTWNGIQINSPSLGQFDLSLFPVLSHNDVFISSGPSGGINGFGGIGGSIELRTNLGPYADTSLQVGAGLGSFGLFRGNVSYSANRQDAGFRVYGGGSFAKNDFSYRDNTQLNREVNKKRENNQFDKYYGGADLKYLLSSHEELHAHVFFAEVNREIPAVLGSSAGQSQSQHDLFLLSSLDYTKTNLAKKRMLTLSAGYNHSQLDFNHELTFISSKTFTNQGQLSAGMKFYGSNHNLTLQGRALYEQAQTPAVFNSSGRVRGQAIIGLESNRASLNYQLFLRPESSGDEVVPLVPVVGVSYSFGKNKSWIAAMNGAKTIRFPSLNDLYWVPGGNMDLKTEEGWTGECKISKHLSQGNMQVQLEALAYAGSIENWIIWLPTDNFWTPQNIRSVRQIGSESALQVTHSLTEQISLRYRGSYQYTQTVDNEIDQQLIYVPMNQVVQRGVLAVYGYQLGCNYQWIDQRFVDPENEVYMPAYDLLDFYFSKSFFRTNHRIEVSFQVNNVLDKDYQVLAYRPMPGINYQFGLRYALH